MTQYKDFRLASEKTHFSLFKKKKKKKVGETGSKYTGSEFPNKNHFAILQLK